MSRCGEQVCFGFTLCLCHEQVCFWCTLCLCHEQVCLWCTLCLCHEQSINVQCGVTEALPQSAVLSAGMQTTVLARQINRGGHLRLKMGAFLYAC